MNAGIKVFLKKTGNDHDHQYELIKLVGAVKVESIIGSFGRDHRINDVLKETEVESLLLSGAYEVTITK